MSFSFLFSNEARMATLRYAAELENLKIASEKMMPDVGGPISFICSRNQQYESARTIKSCGVVFIGEELLLHAPSNIVLVVAIHELFHLRLARNYRTAIAAEHGDIISLFQKQLFDDWLAGRIELWSDLEYLNSKGWRFLYDAWRGPTEVEIHKSVETVNKYFELLKCGSVFLEGMQIATDFFESPHRQATPLVPILEMYLESPQEIAAKIFTGFELVNYLYECVESTIQSRSSFDLGDIEEGLANYISATLLQTPLDFLQYWAPQDPVKISLAKRIESLSLGVSQVFDEVQAYEELVRFHSNHLSGH
jgi:hypothetical protein